MRLLRLALWAVTGALIGAMLIIVAAPEPDRSAGLIQGGPRSSESLKAVSSARDAARLAIEAQAGQEPTGDSRQILFGDLHVH
ncbi:MAG: hypothetical protein AAEJ52_03665, partial [Myxococcota bacterium]